MRPFALPGCHYHRNQPILTQHSTRLYTPEPGAHSKGKTNSMTTNDHKTRIYHNPQCSKSRQTLQLLYDHGADTEVVEYLKQPPDVALLTDILTMLAIEPRQLMRQNEAIYKELQLHRVELSREALIQAMVDHPRLIERPIVISDGKAIIGRPPEKVLEILT